MTKILTGRKASLYAAGMAVSLFAMTGAAHAQVAGGFNGKYKAGTWTVTKEAAGAAKPAATLTADQQAAADAEAAKKATVTGSVVNAINSNSSLVTAYNNQFFALRDEKNALTTAGTAATDLAKFEKNKATADALVATLLTNKTAADLSVTNATTALTAANTARSALTSSATAAEIAAADAAVAKATVTRNLALAAQTPVVNAYNTAVAGAQTALNTYTAGITAKANADAAVLTTQARRLVTTTEFNTAFADTSFLATLGAVNAAAGTSFVATYEGLQTAFAYDDAPAAATYASNGFTRATTTLTAAAASTNQNISLASGALTGSTAALEAGANFETEVLGALVDHEGRIVANTTAISALDVRTTANTTAIATEVTERKAADAALDTRITTVDTRVTTVANAVSKETADRIAADTANNNARIAEDKRLNDLITAEGQARVAMNSELRDRISSSTATAIALGGAALLPDMGFTLSGNVAFYEGAQAVALNAAAKIGPNAYITAAAGGGLNKKGNMGGRVGFVIGF